MEAIETGATPRRRLEPVEGWSAELERLFLGLRRRAGVVTGEGGDRLLESSEGRALMAAGVLARQGERLVVLKPLLTDAVVRAVLALPPVEC
jgi:hypothetical protein